MRSLASGKVLLYAYSSKRAQFLVSFSSIFKRNKKAKEARQRKIHAFWSKKGKGAKGESTLDPDQPEQVPEQAPEQAPAPIDQAPTPVPDEAIPADEDADGGSQSPAEEPSPLDSTIDDDASALSPRHVLSEESKGISVIEPPRKLQRDPEYEAEQRPAGLLCGCI